MRKALFCLFLLFLAASSPVLAQSSRRTPAEDDFMEWVREQIAQTVSSKEAADKLADEYHRVHIEPDKQARRLLEAVKEGQVLTELQARFVMEALRPVMRVDMMRRAAVYSERIPKDTAARFHKRQSDCLQDIERCMPEKYRPVLRGYSQLLDNIYSRWRDTPEKTEKLNKTWSDELDAIRVKELQLYGITPPRKFWRLMNLTTLRNQNNYPICGATSLAMALEVALRRRIDPQGIADVIGWKGTNGPMMWSYAYKRAGMTNALFRTLSLPELKELISNNIPVVVLQNYSEERPFGHARLVVGFKDAERKIEYVESNEGAIRAMDYETFEKLWLATRCSALVLNP